MTPEAVLRRRRVENAGDFIQQAFGLTASDADPRVELNLVYRVWPVEDLVQRVADREKIVWCEVCPDRPVRPSAENLHASKDIDARVRQCSRVHPEGLP
jgi:hypothetical protein